MVLVQLDLDSEENAIVEKLKAAWGLKDKKEAIKKLLRSTHVENKIEIRIKES